MKYFIVPLLALWTFNINAQNSLKAYLKDKETKEPLFSATASLQGTTNGAATDLNGYVELKNIPDGKQVIVYRYIGYEERTDTIEFPLVNNDPIEILLGSADEEMEEVVISTTRSTRTIQNIPTRVEFISGEELEEKANMKPGDIRMVLSESTGIQTQQTSATSASSNIKIQGLDGRYTQIIRDGFPMFSGFSGGLSIMQVAPLDLKQVEIIKGSASTLYGGGAIAGLVNLVSKTPEEKRVLNFNINATSAGGLDLNAFYSQKFKKVGVTIFASRNSNAPYDPAGIGLTAIPKFERYTLNPKLFFYINDKTTLNMGVNSSIENRIGGDIQYIKGKGDSTHSYFEKNLTNRYATQLAFDHKFGVCSHISFKNSFSYFDRSIQIPTYFFKGNQLGSFSELSYSNHKEKSEWIAGVNVYTDNFTEHKDSSKFNRSYVLNTIGFFAQNIRTITKWLQIEAGIRGDYAPNYGFFPLPRLSLLFKITDKLTSRLGGGLGYKSPTIFTEQAEAMQFQNIKEINRNTIKAETSEGINFDINYRTSLFDGKVTFNINQLFFYTKLNKPLVIDTSVTGSYYFANANGHIDTRGGETNIKIGYKHFKLFLGYTYTDTKLHYNGVYQVNPLTPKHRINNILMYEIENKWKFGIEAYYFSPQLLSDGTTGRDYWLCGFMAEKMWKRFSIYINFENFMDTRQTRFGSIYTGTETNPQFKQIYAPVDGFVVNGGIKLKL